MAKFVVPPGNNLGVKMQDGTVYNSKSGTINVENRAHAEQIRDSAARQSLDMIKEPTYALNSNMADRFCPRCTFNCVSWVKNCTRCGAALDGTEYDG